MNLDEPNYTSVGRDLASTHVQCTQTDTNRQNTFTNRTIGKLIVIRQSSFHLSIGAIVTNRFQW